MDPQNVPHLFDCIAHPNDLSPVNLWAKPIETIRELSFLDPGNLNEQTSMVEKGIQQQQQHSQLHCVIWGLEFTNPVGVGGVLDVCLCFGCGDVGGVCGEWVGGLD